jgi:hypothetical protein
MSETRRVLGFLGKKYSDLRMHTQRYLRTSLLTCILTYPNYVCVCVWVCVCVCVCVPPILGKERV